MMRVLFTTFAARSHFFAQVSLASALRTAGHEVVVASQPDVEQDITAAGLTAATVGERLELEAETQEANKAFDDRNLGGLAMSNARDDPYPWDMALGMFSAMTAFVFQNVCQETMVDDLVALSREWRPELVIWDPLTMAGAIAARVTGAAHARLLFGPDQIARNRAAFTAMLRERAPERLDDPLTEWLGWSLERHDNNARGVDEELVLGQWTIDPTPPSMRSPIALRYVPIRYIPYNGPSIVPDWLRAPSTHLKRIVLTLGISMGESPDRGEMAAETMLAAVSGLDVEVVATLPSTLRDRLGRLPDNVRAVDFVPLDLLLPSCAGIVHHGGSGTFMTAMAHGVPQLILPDGMWDSAEKCAGITKAGAGIYADQSDQLSHERLREMIIALVEDPSHAEGAARLRDEAAAAPSPNDLVPLIEQLTQEHTAEHFDRAREAVF